MRSFFILLFCFVVRNVLSQTKTENLDISSIKNPKELEKFINQKFPEGNPFVYNNSPTYNDSICYRIYDSLKATYWLKIDIDQNGKLDLIFADNSDFVSIYCVIDDGNNKYSLNTIPRRFFEPCNFVRKKSVDAKDFLEFFYFIQPNISKLKSRLLTYKYNSVVEYNPNVNDLKVYKIIYTTFNSKLNGEKFAMIIENQSCILKVVGSNMDTIAKKIKVNDSKYNSLLELLNYSNFPKIEYEYPPEWEKYQMSTMTIYYSDSKVKTMDSYSGMYSYFIMEKIYEALYSLKDEIIGLK